LRMGQAAADVAFALGYADQAHMINSLKAIMGQTPGQIAREAVPAT
jgi:AraC-like DNA-binding protein